MSSATAVPAWKRLGLKLKQPGSVTHEPAVGQPAGAQSDYSGSKRKLDAPPSYASPKRPRREDQHQNINNAALKPKKSVTFGETPTKNGPTKAAATNTKAQPKKNKAAAAPPKQKDTKPPTPADIQLALEYLRQWKTSRESWKFNKNHQSTLIKNIFEPETVPANDTDNFYEYIRDLKGFVRTRLRETAMEIRLKDQADGSSGFPDDAMDLDDKQSIYEAVLTEFFRSHLTGTKRKYYNEAQYIANSQDGDIIIHRVVKRMRAEMVLEELSDGEMTDTSTTSTSSRTITANDSTTTISTDGDSRMKPVDGKRRRKLRVNDVEDSSSSDESESDSESDTSSSGSSSDDSDDDEEMENRPNNGYESSSSSSSSSSDESGTEDDSDDED